MKRWHIRAFSGSTTILYDTVMVDTRPYAFSQTHRKHTAKHEPSGKLWTLVDNDVSMLVYQLHQMSHIGESC